LLDKPEETENKQTTLSFILRDSKNNLFPICADASIGRQADSWPDSDYLLVLAGKLSGILVSSVGNFYST
jgi:hypothetical protein